MVFFEEEGVVWEFVLGEEHVDQTLIGLLLFLYGGAPFGFFFRKVPQYYFPAILPNSGSFIGYTFIEMLFECLNVDYILIEHRNKSFNLFGNNVRHALGREFERICLWRCLGGGSGLVRWV